MDLKDHIRAIPDFPKPGILFYDISTLLAHADAWQVAMGRLAQAVIPHRPDVLAGIDRSLPYPPEAMRVPRGKTGGTQKVALPEGYLDSLDDDTPPGLLAEAADSGG